MATTDTCCSIHPYFAIHSGKVDEFKALCERFGTLYIAEWSLGGRIVELAALSS